MFKKKEVTFEIKAEDFEAFGIAVMTEVGLFGNKFDFKVSRGDGYNITVIGLADEVDSFIKSFETAKRGYSIAL